MNKIVRNVILAISLFIVLFPSITLVQEPQNIEFFKRELIKYHDSGEYEQDIKQVALKAKEHLKKCILNNKENRKLAVVLDIDDTALFSYYAHNDNGTLFTFVDIKTFEQLIFKGKWPVVLPVLDLYNFTKEKNVAVFFVSGRKEGWRDITIKQLSQAGYKNWNGIYLKPTVFSPIGHFKELARIDIMSKGYDIVLNIGDQHSDLGASCSGCNFKLPNPFYIISG